jgi:hypothetical protein
MSGIFFFFFRFAMKAFSTQTTTIASIRENCPILHAVFLFQVGGVAVFLLMEKL